MNKLDKWGRILDDLGVSNDKRIKLAEYSEQFDILDEKRRNINIQYKPYVLHLNIPDLLPLNLKILKEIKNFTITSDPSTVEYYEFSLPIKEFKEVKNEIGTHIITKDMGYEIIEYLINKFKNENITIYSLVEDIHIIHKEGYDPFINITSRIKIN